MLQYFPLNLVLMQIKSMMEDGASKDDFESDRKLKRYYQSCTNNQLGEHIGVDPLKRMLTRLGGWPVLEGRLWENGPSFKWHDQLFKMQRIGFVDHQSAIIDYRIEYSRLVLRMPPVSHSDLWRCNNLRVEGPLSDFKIAELFTDRSNATFKNVKIQQYYELMVKSAVELGGNENISKQDFRETLLFMIQVNYVGEYGTPVSTTIGKVNSFLGDSPRSPLPGHPPSWRSFFSNWLKPFDIDINDNLPVTLSQIS